jgi:hypothetical protein
LKSCWWEEEARGGVVAVEVRETAGSVVVTFRTVALFFTTFADVRTAEEAEAAETRG